MPRRLLTLALLLVFAPRAHGGEAEELQFFQLENDLNQTVVTASTGAEEERALASANVYVVNADEIASHGWRSIAEAIANVPGLYVVDDYVQKSVSIRGVNGGMAAGTRIVKVMIDGQVVGFRPDQSAFLGSEFIPIEAVERIEVAKGPLSALYGANAFLATINIITRQAATGVHAQVEGRMNVTRSFVGGGGSAMMSYGGEKVSLLAAVTGDFYDRSGLKLDKTFDTQNTTAPFFQRSSEGDQSRPVGALLQLRLNSVKLGSLMLQGGVQRLDSMGEFQPNSILTHQSRIAITNVWSQAHYEKRWEKAALTANVGYSAGSPDRDYVLSVTDNVSSYYRPKNRYQAVDAAVTGSYSPLAQQLQITGGVDFSYWNERILYFQQTLNAPQGMLPTGTTIDQIGAGVDRTVDNYDIGGFAELKSVPFKRLPGLHLTGNVRVDKINQGPVDVPLQTSWRAAVAYRWNQTWTTKIIAGRAFQTPSGVLLFAQPGFGNVGNLVGSSTLGPSMLRPQQIDSVEANVGASLFGHLTMEASFYYQLLYDKIQFVPVGSNFVARNLGDRNSFGVEASARFNYKFFSSYLAFSIEREVLDGQLVSHAPTQYPGESGVLGVDFDFPKIFFHGNLQGRLVGPRGASESNALLNNGQPYELPAYFELDVALTTVGVHLISPTNETKFGFFMRNILDTRYSQPGYGGFDIPNPGRTILFQVRQSM